MRRVPAGVVWAGVALAVAVAAYLVAGVVRQRPYRYASEPLHDRETAADFTLQSASGPVSLSDFDGDVVLLFFGYTHCPDVCPTEMMRLAQIHRRLPGQDRERVHVLMVTVDPERDTPALMASYAQAFDPSFIGLSGTPAQIADVAGAFYVSYERAGQTRPDRYFVNHTSAAYVLNTERQLALIYGYDQLAAEQAHVARDLSHLLRGRDEPAGRTRAGRPEGGVPAAPAPAGGRSVPADGLPWRGAGS
ncbi:MAG TPA: SCO family protein [Trueperaceae bacterium]|nr:SCO family protein [Trueperaceae bacterium]